MGKRPHVPAEEMEPRPGSGDRNRPTVIGPIIGPAITTADGQPAVPVNETPFLRTSTPEPRRLTDLPGAETFLAPGLEGLYSSLAADPPGEPRSDLEPYVAYNSPDTPPDPTIFNIAQIVVKLVEGSCVKLDGGELIITPDVKKPANVNRLRRAGVELRTVRRQVNDFNSVVAGRAAVVWRAAPQVDPELLAMLHRRAENESGTEMPNPNLFYFVHSQRTKPEAAAALLAALRRLPIVEAAYFQP